MQLYEKAMWPENVYRVIDASEQLPTRNVYVLDNGYRPATEDEMGQHYLLTKNNLQHSKAEPFVSDGVETPMPMPAMNFSGQGDAAPVENVDDDVLPLPVMKF